MMVLNLTMRMDRMTVTSRYNSQKIIGLKMQAVSLRKYEGLSGAEVL